MRHIKRSITIREMPDGRWLNKLTGRYYGSFIGIQQALRREAQGIVRDIPDAILLTVLNWETTSNVGRLIVKSLAVSTKTVSGN